MLIKYLQGKGSSSRPSDDQTRTLLRIYLEDLEMKAGSSIRLAQDVSASSGSDHVHCKKPFWCFTCSYQGATKNFLCTKETSYQSHFLFLEAYEDVQIQMKEIQVMYCLQLMMIKNSFLLYIQISKCFATSNLSKIY